MVRQRVAAMTRPHTSATSEQGFNLGCELGKFVSL